MIASTRPKVRMVLLAAGLSTRLGMSKSLARVRGTSLIRRTVLLLAPLADSPIVVVIPARAARVRAELRGQRVSFVENPQRAIGLSTSVHRGMAAAYPAAGVLLLPVDLARLKRRDLARLLARWRGARRRVVALRFGRHGGAPLIVPRWLCARALTASGDRGLRDLVNQLSPEHLTLVTLPSAAADVDTPLDLERARRRSSR